MYKIIDEINISGKEDFFTLNNTKNDAQVTISLEKGRITFNDSCGNTMQNYPSVTRINFEIFNLTEIGQTITEKMATSLPIYPAPMFRNSQKKHSMNMGKLECMIL